MSVWSLTDFIIMNSFKHLTQTNSIWDNGNIKSSVKVKSALIIFFNKYTNCLRHHIQDCVYLITQSHKYM